jgi:hypothetical protein
LIKAKVDIGVLARKAFHLKEEGNDNQFGGKYESFHDIPSGLRRVGGAVGGGQRSQL